MRQPQHQSVIRPIIAMVTAFAFIFSPFSTFAQQGPEEQGEAEGQKEGEKAEPDKPAGPTPKLFLLPTQGVRDDISSIVPERIGEMLRSQMQGKSEVELLPEYDRLEQQGGGQANAAVAEAERLYTSGIGLLTAGEDKKASEAFQKSVDIMEENIADLNNFDILADAYKNMALAYFNAGFDFDGRKKMKVFAHLRPEAKLDEEKFPKELRSVFNDEVKKVKKGGHGKLVVEANVAEAKVFVDGVEKGVAPVTIEDVGYGYHYMVVRAPNGSAWADQIRVRGRGKSQKFKAELGGNVDAGSGDDSGDPAFYSGLKQSIKSGSFGQDLQPYLAELTTRTGANVIAWVAMLKGDSGYVAVPFIYRPEDKRLVRAESVEFNFELSNLRIGVVQLGNRIAEAVETMPEDKVVTSVELGAPVEEEEPAVAAGEVQDEPAASAEDDGEQAAGAVAVSETSDAADEAQGQSVKPLPEPSEEEGESNKWMWVGAGSAAVLVTGLVVGGIVMMSDAGSDGTGSFDAQLTW